MDRKVGQNDQFERSNKAWRSIRKRKGSTPTRPRSTFALHDQKKRMKSEPNST